MFIKGEFEKARQYIEIHSAHDPDKKYEFYPCITISRETGAGSDIVSEKLIKFFDKYRRTEAPEWTIFDKNLIAKVLEDHHLPIHLQKFLIEDKFSEITSMINELLTGEPSARTMIKKEVQTIHQLCKTGNVIIIGRGANFITSKFKNSFHVRLVAPMEERIKRIEQLFNLSRKDAELYIRKDDIAKKSFVLTYFQQNVENPLLYHLVINTGDITHSEAAKIIGKAVIKRFSKVFPKDTLRELSIK